MILRCISPWMFKLWKGWVNQFSEITWTPSKCALSCNNFDGKLGQLSQSVALFL